MSSSKKITRRKVIGGIGALSAVAVSQGFSNELKDNANPRVLHALEDPVNKYPKPPFKGQSQKWPALASQMDPRPDHGEKSYKGSGRLADAKH